MDQLIELLDYIRGNYILLFVIGGILSAYLALNTNNPIVCLGFFISLICNAAGFLVGHGVYFIGFTYILIYVGAIAILFLFIIMLINIKTIDFYPFEISVDFYSYSENISSTVKNYLFILVLFVGLFSYEVFNILVPSALGESGFFNSLFYGFDIYYNSFVTNLDVISYSDITIIGNLFYSEYSLLFILIGFMLILSICGAIYLVSL